MSGDFDLLLLKCALTVLVLYLFVPPTLIYFLQRFRANPTLIPFDLEQQTPPGEAGRYFMEVDQQFAALGFDRRAALTLPDAVPNVKALLVFYANRRSKDVALTAIMYGLNPVDQTVAMKSSYVEILARFQDGELEALHTNNVRMLGSFPTTPGSRTYRFPHLEDLSRLFELHQKLLERDRPVGRKYIRTDEEFDGDCVAYMHTVFRETYDRQIGTGYLYFQPSQQVYRPTIKGALFMTWRELFPIKQILWEGAKAQAKRLEQELS
ncbi:MAG: hypothetical protein JWM11_8031 [Planctomycetaceae bacterium]|nr:hypothetical protein [Planctomycetaceae bacterium]